MDKYIYKIIKLLCQGHFHLENFLWQDTTFSIISLILLSTGIEVTQWTFNELAFVPPKTFLKIISDQAIILYIIKFT